MRKKRRKIIIYFGFFVIAAIAGMHCGMGPSGAYLEVDDAHCIGCTRCKDVCISDAVRMIDGRAVIDPTKCIKCEKCVEICPVNAIY